MAKTKTENALLRKDCSKCGLNKPIGQFRTITDRKTQLVRRHSWCIPCQREHQKLRRRASSTMYSRRKEADRVAEYQTDEMVKERRSARSAAQYRALAALRDLHRAEYEKIYQNELKTAGLDPA